MPVGVFVDIKTGDLERWAKKIEDKGADIGAMAMRQVKRSLEVDRKQYKTRLPRRVRRLKSGQQRFVAARPPVNKAQGIPKTFAANFHDIFESG